MASAGVEPGERARPARVGVGAQHRDGARERGGGRRQPREPVADEAHELRRRAASSDSASSPRRAGVREQLAEIQRIAAGDRARPRDDLDRPRPAEHRLDAAARCRRPTAAPARAARTPARRPGTACRVTRAAGRAATTSASGSCSRAPRGQPQQPERQVVGPLGVVEEQRERLLVGQLRPASQARRAMSQDASDSPLSVPVIDVISRRRGGDPLGDADRLVAALALDGDGERTF